MSPWNGIERLVDDLHDRRALRVHGVQLLAARRWRALGRPVPPDLRADEQRAAVAALAVPLVLARIRSALDGPVVLIKGPEIAARYPTPTLRPLGDIDLLVPDPAVAHKSLLAAGFEVDWGNESNLPHHLPPLRWPGSPLPVEVHGTLRAPTWVNVPTHDDLTTAAVPTLAHAPGILTLAPLDHAMVVAAHGWGHGPFSRLLDLVDIAVLTAGSDRTRLAARADVWGMRHLWSATIAVVDALLLAGSPPPPLPRFLSRHLHTVREQTVFEHHLARWLSSLYAPTPRAAVQAMRDAAALDLLPGPGDTWGRKRARIGRALRRALVPLSDHIHRT